MSNILIFSDVHIHCHKGSVQRLQDCLDVLKWAFQTARDNNIKDVIFLGDLFHDRTRIQVMAYHKTFEIFSEYRDLNVYLLLGNHDLWFYDKWDIHTVSPLSALPNVRIIDKPSTVKIADLNFDFLPFTHNLIDVITTFKTKSSVLCGHVAINNATLNYLYSTTSDVCIENDKDMIKVDKDLLSGWRKVFLGHYHCQQKLDDRIEYIGSPLQLSFNEAFQKKHIIIFDTDSFETKYIENTFSPKHLIVRSDEIDKIDLDNNFIQVQVDNLEKTDVIELKKLILDENKPQSLEFKESKKTDIKEKHQDMKVKFDIATGNTLERYMSSVDLGNLDKNKLLTIGKEISNEN